jgi:hypothetical protein
MKRPIGSSGQFGRQLGDSPRTRPNSELTGCCPGANRRQSTNSRHSSPKNPKPLTENHFCHSPRRKTWPRALSWKQQGKRKRRSHHGNQAPDPGQSPQRRPQPWTGHAPTQDQLVHQRHHPRSLGPQTPNAVQPPPRKSPVTPTAISRQRPRAKDRKIDKTNPIPFPEQTRVTINKAKDLGEKSGEKGGNGQRAGS